MKKRKLERKLLSFLLSLAMVIGFMPGMGMTAYAADTTITWDSSVINGINLTQVNQSFTNSGITVKMTAMEMTEVGYGGFNNNVMRANATFEFSSTVGNIKGITINAGNTGITVYSGWTKDGTTVTWSGTPASSVTLSVQDPGRIMNISSIVFTIKGANVDVTGVTLNKTETTLTVGGDPVALTATVAPENATDRTVTWTTSDASVATVEDGVVTAVAAGTATITATATNGTVDTSDDKTATCTVTVNAAAPSVVSVTGVEINKTSTTLTVGGTETLTATVSPDGATYKTVTWSSSDTDVATVDANGKVSAVAAGTATITVTATNGTVDDTSDDQTATCAVTVNAASSGGGSSDSGSGDSSDNSSSNNSNNDSSNNNNSSNDSGNSNSEPKDETPYDYLEPLREDLKAEIALGGERTVTWDKGTALPYDIMKTLQDNPGVTLTFSYTYQGIDYKVTISGKDAKAYTEIPWYGPLYLYKHYGSSSETAPADTADTAIGTRTYTVIPGDTLSEIATKLNTTVDSLVSLNDIKNRDFILVGQILKY